MGNKLNSYNNQIGNNPSVLTNISYSAIQGGYEGIANINLSENNDGSSPLSYVRFTDPNNDDYTLLPNSVCINRGNTIAPYIISIDLAGLRRIKNTFIDIEAMNKGVMLIISSKTLFVKAVVINRMALTIPLSMKE